MREHDALRIAGAARGVLQEGEVVRRARNPLERPGRLFQIGHRDYRIEAFDQRLDQLRQAPRLGHRDQDRRVTVLQNTALSSQVILELRRPQRWINRYRHAAGEQRAEEAVKVIGRGREHQRDRSAGFKAPLLQSARDLGCALSQLAVGDDVALAVVLVELDVGSVGVLFGVPVEHFDQRLRAIRRGLDPSAREFPGTIRDKKLILLAVAFDRVEQVARRLGFGEDTFGQRNLEGLFDAGDQFDPAEAVQPGVVLQRGFETDVEVVGAARMQFGRQRPNQFEQPGLDWFAVIASLWCLHTGKITGFSIPLRTSYAICADAGELQRGNPALPGTACANQGDGLPV